MPSPAEIAYREAVRALEGQGQDLEATRSHVSLVLSAAGIAAVFLGIQSGPHGVAFGVAIAAFSAVALMTILVYWPIDFAWDFDGYQLVGAYVDQDPPLSDDFVMRELAVHASDGYRANRERLNRLFTLQSVALVAFGFEVAALLVNLVLE